MKIPATVIWYNPDDENIKNIRTYIDYVEKLYIIDNSKENNKKSETKANETKTETKGESYYDKAMKNLNSNPR